MAIPLTLFPFSTSTKPLLLLGLYFTPLMGPRKGSSTIAVVLWFCAKINKVQVKEISEIGATALGHFHPPTRPPSLSYTAVPCLLNVPFFPAPFSLTHLHHHFRLLMQMVKSAGPNIVQNCLSASALQWKLSQHQHRRCVFSIPWGLQSTATSY